MLFGLCLGYVDEGNADNVFFFNYHVQYLKRNYMFFCFNYRNYRSTIGPKATRVNQA